MKHSKATYQLSSNNWRPQDGGLAQNKKIVVKSYRQGALQKDSAIVSVLPILQF
jgi:hypothetical protein